MKYYSALKENVITKFVETWKDLKCIILSKVVCINFFRPTFNKGSTSPLAHHLAKVAEEEYREEDDLVLFDSLEPWKKTKLRAGTYSLRPLMEQIFQNGQCCYTSPSVMDIRAYCQRELDTLWEETKRLVNPHEVYVDLSQKLYDTKIRLLEEMSAD